MKSNFQINRALFFIKKFIITNTINPITKDNSNNESSKPEISPVKKTIII